MQQVTGAHLKDLAADITTAGHYIYSLGQGNPLDKNVELGEILMQLAQMVKETGEHYERDPNNRSRIESLQKLLASKLFNKYPQTLDTLRAQIPEENAETAEAFNRASINLRKLAEELRDNER